MGALQCPAVRSTSAWSTGGADPRWIDLLFMVLRFLSGRLYQAIPSEGHGRPAGPSSKQVKGQGKILAGSSLDSGGRITG